MYFVSFVSFVDMLEYFWCWFASYGASSRLPMMVEKSCHIFPVILYLLTNEYIFSLFVIFVAFCEQGID
jgi:hypothetical protein